MSLVSLILGFCYGLDIHCQEKINKCIDQKAWEYREIISDPREEHFEIFFFECVDNYEKK